MSRLMTRHAQVYLKTNILWWRKAVYHKLGLLFAALALIPVSDANTALHKLIAKLTALKSQTG